MQDKFFSTDSIKIDLENINQLGDNLTRNLSLLNQNISYIITKIKACETIDFAREYFDLLDLIHTTLCRLQFSYEIGLPDKLREFVSSFDNLEGKLTFLFDSIKNGSYTY